MSHVVSFFENLYFRPKWYHWPVAIFFLPISLLYAFVVWFRRKKAVPQEFGLPIVSIGNLLIGGSGKTPMTVEMARRYDKPAVVLRGYGRKSRGLLVVSRWGEIETVVEKCGDEAMLLAKSLPKATIIVSENRSEAIKLAERMGAKIVFLDDGFAKVGIKKFDILLYPQNIPNPLPLPSGPFREFPFAKRYAQMILTEGKDFRRIVSCNGCDEPLLLVTAIANPQRLEPFLPQALVKGRYILPDHSWFDKESIEKAMKKAGVRKILTTEKDAVKLERFGFDLAVLRLRLQIDEEVFKRVDSALGFDSSL